ncbi:MAG TPA: serine/threonine-protein kinase, partial [Candidatus Obscuribacter sp.]|nr:serine/threonine-protein kinase [Candidatus Obscuribacter sp.]
MLSKETHSGSYRKICLTCGKEFAEDILLCPDDDELLTPIKADNLIGTVLSGKYEILEKLGAGGMGLVYKAKHTLMKRLVAIKIMLPQLIASVSALKRFKQEAQAASSLNHPNILTVFDFGVTPDGMPYLVMDYLEGTNLTKLLETNQHLPLDVAVDIFIQTASGLAHAHRKGIV